MITNQIARHGLFAHGMHARWTLLNTCDRACSYCPSRASAENCILLPDRLLAMAGILLELPHDHLDITIAGGEPGLHPLLPELARFLLLSPRQPRLRLETHGALDLDFYADLLAINPVNAPELVIGIHPAWADPKSTLELVALCHKAGAPARVKLAHDPAARSQTQNFAAMLLKLRETIDFNAEITPLREPRGALRPLRAYTPADAQWRDQCAAAFAAFSTTAAPAPQFFAADGAPVAREHADFSGFYCCHAANYLRIDNDGRVYGANCSQARCLGSLWELDADDLARACAPVPCRISCPDGAGCVLPKFKNYSDAASFLASFERTGATATGASPALAILASQAYNLEEAAANQPGRAPAQPGLFSVILTACNDAGRIRQSLDSVLVQGAAVEIVAVDRGSSDGTADILADYAALYPGIARWRRKPAASNADARNTALDMARGERILLLEAGELLPARYLERVAAQAGGAGADMLVPLPASTPPPRHSLNFFTAMVADAAHLSVGGALCVYSAAFLRQSGLRFDEPALGARLRLELKARHCARNIQFMPAEQVVAPARDSFHLDEFAACIGQIETFCAERELSPAFCRQLAGKFYAQNRAAFLQALQAEATQPPLAFSASPLLLELILCDYAAAFCRDNQIALPVAAADLDWRSAAGAPPPKPACTAWGNADRPVGRAPLLTVIMPNYNKLSWLPAALRSILTQSMPDFELIVIDDASTDGSAALLVQCADADARIRLFQMAENCRQGACRNIGLEHARGRYVIFADSDDICLPGYFSAACALLEDGKADLGIFACQREQKNGAFAVPLAPLSGNLSQTDALQAFAEKRLAPEVWGKIYRADALRQLRFPEHVYHQDIPFLLDALLACQKIVASPLPVYRQRWSQNSAIRPDSATYLHIHSACCFYDFVARATARLRKRLPFCAALDGFGRDFILWNLENVLLAKIDAFERAGAGFPLTSADCAALAANAFFWQAVLAGAAKTLSAPPATAPVATANMDAPLVSAIVIAENETGLSEIAESILKQSLTALELIAIVNGANDDSASILEQYAAQDGRLRILRNDRPLAPGACLAQALAQARGAYIWRAQGMPASADLLLAAAAALAQNADASFVALTPDGDARRPRRQGSAAIAKAFSAWREGACNVLWRKEALRGPNLPDAALPESALLLAAGQSTGLVLGQPASKALASAAMTARQTEWNLRFFPWLETIVAPEAGNCAGAAAARAINHFYLALAAPAFEYLQGALAKGRNAVNAGMAATLAAPDILERFLRQCAAAADLAADTLARKRVDALMPEYLAEQAAPPFLSILVCARNCAPALENTLAQLACLPADLAEIVLVDNASEDDTLAAAMRLAPTLNVKIFAAPWRASMANALALALEQASGQYLLPLGCGQPLAAGALLALAGQLRADNPDLAVCANLSRRASALELCRAFCAGASVGVATFNRDFLQKNRLVLADHAWPMAHFLLRALLAARQIAVFAGNLPAPAREDASALACIAGAKAMLGLARQAGDMALRQHVANWLLASAQNFVPPLLAGARGGDCRAIAEALAPLLADVCFGAPLLASLLPRWQNRAGAEHAF